MVERPRYGSRGLLQEAHPAHLELTVEPDGVYVKAACQGLGIEAYLVPPHPYTSLCRRSYEPSHCVAHLHAAACSRRIGQMNSPAPSCLQTRFGHLSV